MRECMQFYSSQYSVTLGIFCILLYLYGFFPVKKSSNVFSTEHDFPSSLQDIKFNRDKVYNRSASKTVLMIIDGLRVDFVTPQNMPYTMGVVFGAAGGGCQLTARVAAPTVTLPRLKAIVTGSVSGFIDVVLNLGTVELTSDNIIQQFSQTRRAVFFGDDTWIKMFPQQFTRSDGTSSFFVNDYTEVDDNVTRHLNEELQSSDWDLMVLHYLGLDHIGHIEGPKSALVNPKLREMDGIIERLHAYLLKQDGGVLVVCGDHGMKDSGSHGGVSLPEVLVPVVVLGLHCPQHFKQEILQVDLAATLSVLWGSPIPADNIGVVTPALISHLSPAQRLYAQLHNAHQLSANFLRNGGYITHEGYQKYEEAKAKHHQWLANSSSVSHQEVEALYQESLIRMSRFLSQVLANYNMLAMCSAIVILFQVLCTLALKLLGNQSTLHQHSLSVLLASLVLVGSLMATSLVSPLQIMLITSAVFFTFNSIGLYTQLRHASFFFKFKVIQSSFLWNEVILPAGMILFCFSLFSSSLIEEEHQIWYFLWATVCMLRLVESPVQWLAVLLAHRFLRRLNSTGDKWAHLPDISDWLMQADNRLVLSLLCGASLLIVVWCCAKLHYSRLSLLLYVSTAFFIYQHKAAIQQVNSFISSWGTNGVTEARICWFLLVSLLVVGRSLRSLITCWMLTVCLLLRPYNTVLVPAMFIISNSLQSSLTSSTILPLWIGYVFYFYQGNSNSLASVDIAAGFVGLEGYSVSLVAVLLLAHTYAMPVLAYLLQVQFIMERSREWQQKVVAITELMAFVQLLHMFVYLIVITLQRYHLFVWTVFSPKLLYVAAQTLQCFILVSITNICLCYIKSRKQLFYV